MTDQHKQARDVLDQLAEAVRSEPVPAGPAKEIDQALLALAGKPPRPQTQLTTRIIHMKPIVKLAALAAAAVVVIGLFVWLRGHDRTPHGIAFADVQKKLNAVRTVSYKKVREENGKVIGEAKVIAELPGRIRTETPDGSYVITDYEKGQNTQLKMSGPKRVMIVAVQPKTPPDLLAELRQMVQADSPKELGEKQLDKRKATGYLVKKDDNTAEIWVDAATGLPILVTIDRATSRIIARDFVFDASLDESVFDPKPPEGYRVVRADMNPDHASEKDVLSALELLAKHNGGSFPDKGLGQALQQYSSDLQQDLQDRTAQRTKEELERLEDDLQVNGALGGRVTRFNNGKWEYAGGGVKLGDAKRPIFWYQPRDAEKYRVIFGDLSVQDFDASQLPAREPATKAAAQ